MSRDAEPVSTHHAGSAPTVRDQGMGGWIRVAKLRHAAHYVCVASHLSNCAISFFCATMICLAMAFIYGDLPFASSISAIFKAC